MIVCKARSFGTVHELINKTEVAFFIFAAFTRRSSLSSALVPGVLPSSSPLSPTSAPHVSINTTDIKAVIESLAKAVKYNMKRE